LHLSGNNSCFSIIGPIFSISKLSKLFTKKTTCGLPTLIAVPPICDLLSLSRISICKFFVFTFFESGISFQLVFPNPIPVSTRFFPSISDLSSPADVTKEILFLPFSFDKRSATHLVPFPHAPDALPSELKKSIFASDLS
jgi:hypothetical protein